MPITLANGDLCQCCELVAGRLPSASEVRRTAEVISLVVPRQREVGHLIVFPIRHATTLLDLSDREVTALAAETLAMAQGLMTAFAPDGFLIYQNNGTASFQEVPHVHFHVVPRRSESEWPTQMRWSWDRPVPPPTAEVRARLLEARP